MSQDRSSRPVRGVVAEKRRASERLKEEPTPKRRESGTQKPAKQEKKQKTIHISTPASPAQEVEAIVVLPSKIVDGQPLPTSKELQPKDLSDSEYKSITDSGVLSASIDRSRKHWTHDVFDKYWSKPCTKAKKNMTEEERRAEAERKVQEKRRGNMTRFGECRMIVEPHIFDVNLFLVKDSSALQINQTNGQPFVQYGHQPSQTGTPTPAYTSTQFRPSPLQQASPAPAAPETPHPPLQTSQLPPATEPRNPAAVLPPKATPKNPPPTPQPRTAPPAPVPQPQRPDPVIHMLAQRAATDHELKAVMTIVATGKATAKQLEFFQKHIDELTRIARSNEEAEQRRNSPAHSQQQRIGSPVNTMPSTPSQNQSAGSQPQMQVQPQPRPPHPNQYTYQTAAPKAPKLNPHPQHVVMEFTNHNTNDRFLFPRYSILEFLPGMKTCVVSFLVVRKLHSHHTLDSDGVAYSSPTPAGKNQKKNIDEEKEVYQPVTVKFTASDSKILTMLAQVVAPQDEVRQYMEDVMARAERASEGILAMRLPRKKAGVGLDGLETV